MLTEMTKPGDPMMRIRLPKTLHQAILITAKKNKRRPQDEIIKRVIATFKANPQFNKIQKKFLPGLKKLYQD